MIRAIRIESPAKINLHLEVLGKRPDGYHELETLMTRVSLCDTLDFQVTDGPLELQVQAISASDARELPPPDNNLILRALQALREFCGCTRGMQVRLVKRIPIKAGLGGASSNAAMALRAANHLWELRLPPETLAGIANQLGSDIAYFLQDDMALCRGRGEQVSSVVASYGWPVVLIQPPFGLSTRDVFAACRPMADIRSPQAILASVADHDPVGVAQHLFNRLEEAVGAHRDWYAQVRGAMARAGALGGQMTGSGSCFFGLFRNAAQAQRAQRQLQAIFRDCRVLACRTTGGYSGIPQG